MAIFTKRYLAALKARARSRRALARRRAAQVAANNRVIKAIMYDPLAAEGAFYAQYGEFPLFAPPS
jgi:hypothetical protein